MDEVRKPDCASCPLSEQPKVWGVGPLSAELLIVAEAPGPDEEKEGVPLIGRSGVMVNIMLAQNGIARADVRIENVFQCKAAFKSKEGTKAVAACGPSLRTVVDAMPRLKQVVAFGEAALQEVSGYAPTERALKRTVSDNTKGTRKAATAVRRYEKAVVSHRTKYGKWQVRFNKWVVDSAKATAKGKVLKRKRPQAPALPERPVPFVPTELPQPQGWHAISLFRGSPLRLPYRQAVGLLPILHPASTMPFRQPRLRPLLSLDFRKAVDFMRGIRSIPSSDYAVLRTVRDVETWLADLPQGDAALDIEWSRAQRELMCIGLGVPGRWAIIPYLERAGLAWRPSEWATVRSLLNASFALPTIAWGGHNSAGYDERKLAERAILFTSAWDTLTMFHLLFSEFGSPRDDAAVNSGKFTQASGYDLGFVSSVLTDFPYHKGVVTGERDAFDVPTDDLYRYCVGDVARTWYSRRAMVREATSSYPSPDAFARFQRLLAMEMAVVRRAAQMTLRGVPINDAERAKREASWLDKLTRLLREAQDVVGDPSFNLNSTTQLARVLEARWGIAVRWDGDSGRPSLDSKVVDKLLAQYPSNPLLRVVGDVRECGKEVAAYRALTPDSRGRAHPSWRVHGTVGARWSSTPNFQNLTKEQREVIQ